ncbi:MAG TPA: tripartite tricarboxylate transporter substrate binding protein [Burkholderiales bacterium]|nr:tripartite tricarboxylate transporter substrate binding protein [Burkholderiales bacterium]
MPSIPRQAALAALLLAAAAGGDPAHAQSYPSKPVTLIVPYPPGGGTDFFARTVGQKMAETLGQPVVLVVENRPGAATIVGAQVAAKAPADGYTVLLGDSATYAINPSLYKKLPYDPVKDFAPVSLTGRFALLLVVNPAVLPVDSTKALVAQARKHPGGIAYGSPGSGSPHHLAMELFKQRAGIDLLHVPYKGAAPAVQDLLGGRIATMFLDLAAGAPQVKGGKVRALAVASPTRIAALPDVPTLNESGFPGFEAWAWQGLAVPAGTPKEIIARLNSAYAKAIADPAVRQKVSDAGIEPLQSTPQEMADYIRSETAKWAKLIADRHITVD